MSRNVVEDPFSGRIEAFGRLVRWGRSRTVSWPLPGDGCGSVGLEVQRPRFPHRWFKVVLSPPAGDPSEGGGRGLGVAPSDLLRESPVFLEMAETAKAAAIDTTS